MESQEMTTEVVSEKPVLELAVQCGTGYRDCSVYASQLYDCKVGDIVVDDGMSSAMCGDDYLVTVAHKTKSTVVLLVERWRWHENYSQIERTRETKLVAVELHR